MTTSGTIGSTVFSTRRVIDHAFRRCRIPAEGITSEMQDYAKDALYLLLGEIANVKAPSWCIERQIYPFYQGVAEVPLATGTVGIMNILYRTGTELIGTVTELPLSYTVDFSSNGVAYSAVDTVGLKWSGVAVPVTFEVSSDGLAWVTVGSQSTSAVAGERTWADIVTPGYPYFRITSVDPMLLTEVYLGTMGYEIPLGVLNRDDYVNQSNKYFQSRPLTFWYQRSFPQQKLNLWPVPNLAAEHAQLIVWRHRHIMDVGTLAQDLEIPQRWTEAVVSMLAAKVAAETPQVDPALIGQLEQKALTSYQVALAGDNTGSSTYIQPAIGVYSR